MAASKRTSKWKCIFKLEQSPIVDQELLDLLEVNVKNMVIDRWMNDPFLTDLVTYTFLGLFDEILNRLRVRLTQGSYTAAHPISSGDPLDDSGHGRIFAACALFANSDVKDIHFTPLQTTSCCFEIPENEYVTRVFEIHHRKHRRSTQQWVFTLNRALFLSEIEGQKIDVPQLYPFRRTTRKA